MKKLLLPENFNVCKIYYKMELKILSGIYLEPSMGTVMFVSYFKIVEASNNLPKNEITFAERVHCLNVLQLVAFSK